MKPREYEIKPGADLMGANLREADLMGANLREANLRGANLRGANLRGADLWRADLRRADLREADLMGADLRGADLREADLRRADLWRADLRRADLWRADLRRADLMGADLREILLPVTDKLLICPWSVCHIQRDNIRIGCEYHSTEEWESFTDEEITAMDPRALGWWKQNKEVVLFIANKCAPYDTGLENA